MVGAALPVRGGACSRSRWAPRLAAIALVVLGSMVLAPVAAFAEVQAVGGSAFGEQTDVLAGAVTSGPLPSATLPDGGGGPVTASASSSCVPAGLCGVLRTGALSVSTQGSAGGSDGVRGYAQVANVDVAAGVVTGELVRSRCPGR